MELILKYFPNLSLDKIDRFQQLQALYNEWNSKINVVSRKDIDELYLKHILHSLAIAKFISFKDNSRILDVGTGGGFPGIPLAIMFPECDFVLVDSIKKKMLVVDEVVKALDLKNVKTRHCRVEEVKNEFDFIVSRAVTTMPEFVGWVKGRIRKKSLSEIKNGIIYLKGGDLSEELKGYKTVQVKDLKDYFEEDFFESKKIVYLPMKYGR